MKVFIWRAPSTCGRTVGGKSSSITLATSPHAECIKCLMIQLQQLCCWNSLERKLKSNLLESKRGFVCSHGALFVLSSYSAVRWANHLAFWLLITCWVSLFRYDFCPISQTFYFISPCSRNESSLNFCCYLLVHGIHKMLFFTQWTGYEFCYAIKMQLLWSHEWKESKKLKSAH